MTVQCIPAGQSFAEQLSISRGGGGGASDTPPPSLSDWANFLRVFGQSKFFSGAFGASQFRPKNFFGASNNSGSPARGGGGSPPFRKTLPLGIVSRLQYMCLRLLQESPERWQDTSRNCRPGTPLLSVPPPPPLSKLRPCPSYSWRRDRINLGPNFHSVPNVVQPHKTWVW